MKLYHRTCRHQLPLIEAESLLLPQYQPVLGRRLVWMADVPDLGRLALGLTGTLTGCDRMEHLVTVEVPLMAKPWLDYARRNGIDPSRLETQGTRPRHWWVSEHPQATK